MSDKLFEKFKNRECKARDIFDIREIPKNIAYEFIRKYHYLGDAKFFSMYSFGLFIKSSDVIVGCATYSSVQGVHTLKGWFNIENNNSKDVVELSRLCVLPELNGTNTSSFLLGNSIKMLKKYNVKAVITLADATRHIGSIYQVCNFTYYGMCDPKSDFYWVEDSRYPYRSTRYKIKDLQGVWIPKTRKHRYALILDKSLKCCYEPQEKPSDKLNTVGYSCCDDTYVVYDNRYHKYYTCPKCTKKMIEIDKNCYENICLLKSKYSSTELLDYVNSLINIDLDEEKINLF